MVDEEPNFIRATREALGGLHGVSVAGARKEGLANAEGG